MTRDLCVTIYDTSDTLYDAESILQMQSILYVAVRTIYFALMSDMRMKCGACQA